MQTRCARAAVRCRPTACRRPSCWTAGSAACRPAWTAPGRSRCRWWSRPTCAAGATRAPSCGGWRRPSWKRWPGRSRARTSCWPSPTATACPRPVADNRFAVSARRPPSLRRLLERSHLRHQRHGTALRTGRRWPHRARAFLLTLVEISSPRRRARRRRRHRRRARCVEPLRERHATPRAGADGRHPHRERPAGRPRSQLLCLASPAAGVLRTLSAGCGLRRRRPAAGRQRTRAADAQGRRRRQAPPSSRVRRRPSSSCWPAAAPREQRLRDCGERAGAVCVGQPPSRAAHGRPQPGPRRRLLPPRSGRGGRPAGRPRSRTAPTPRCRGLPLPRAASIGCPSSSRRNRLRQGIAGAPRHASSGRAAFFAVTAARCPAS